MPVKLDEIIQRLEPKRTVLLFGSGSSIPSGAPSAAQLIARFSDAFSIDPFDLKLSEMASLAEKKTSRAALIKELRSSFKSIKPVGGIKNLPAYNWKSIFTTNYDTIIEQTYELHKKICRACSSNFDFGIDDTDSDAVLYKLHGTIEKDACDGNQSRIILTEGDYDQTEPYREYLYDRLKGDLAGAELIIIGHSLADPDLNAVIKRAITINRAILSPSRLALLLYTPDENRAQLYEDRGLTVAFGGIDDFFAVLALKKSAAGIPSKITLTPFDQSTHLRLSTVDVANESDQAKANFSAMFNGWPATYSDIEAGFTFERNISKEILNYLETEDSLCAIILGAAGVGKSTAARQAIQASRRAGYRCWEHINDQALSVDGWISVANMLKNDRLVGVLLIDDAHAHLRNLNDLIDRLVSDGNRHLKIVITSTRNNWYPRNKTPNIYKHGCEFRLSKLTSEEIERLLNLIERQPDVRALVESVFSGFSRQERRRRLADRCEADMFVCLKNIFASEAFDDIILREYAELDHDDQEIYRHVAAMETAGVRVHRQLVIRLLHIRADLVSSVLNNLSEIINEYAIDERYGIFGWRCRHPVISGIITKFRYKSIDETVDLFDRVIDKISPTYDIEIRTIRDLCNLETGISRIPDLETQNRLFRKMISNAPGERVPRHRLIRNLINQGAFDKADTEIRVFNKDFGSDGPVHRYKVKLMMGRAIRTPGLLDEDRLTILEQAREMAVAGVSRFPHNKSILSVFAELGIEFFKRTGSYEVFDAAIKELKLAEEQLGDPDITAIISRYERRVAGHSYEGDENVTLEDIDSNHS